jgi:hypothetical protein
VAIHNECVLVKIADIWVDFPACRIRPVNKKCVQKAKGLDAENCKRTMSMQNTYFADIFFLGPEIRVVFANIWSLMLGSDNTVIQFIVVCLLYHCQVIGRQLSIF